MTAGPDAQNPFRDVLKLFAQDVGQGGSRCDIDAPDLRVLELEGYTVNRSASDGGTPRTISGSSGKDALEAQILVKSPGGFVRIALMDARASGESGLSTRAALYDVDVVVVGNQSAEQSAANAVKLGTLAETGQAVFIIAA